MKVVMEFIPESEQLFDIAARSLSLHSLFVKPGLLKSKTCSVFNALLAVRLHG